MKHITTSIFCAMVIATSVFCSEKDSLQQRQAELNLQIAKDQHIMNQQSMIESQLRESNERHKQNQKDANERCLMYFDREAKVAAFKAKQVGSKLKSEEAKLELVRVKAELIKLAAENDFRQCLVTNIHNPDLGPSGIPQNCQDLLKVWRLLGGGSEIDKLIEEFKK